MFYTPGVLVELMCVAFDPGRSWGARLGDGGSPDPGMPRGDWDPSVCGTLWALCADCQRAMLALPEGCVRNRVWCKYVEGHTVAAIAAAEGVTVKAVEASLYKGVRDMCEFLNGEPWVDCKAGSVVV